MTRRDKCVINFTVDGAFDQLIPIGQILFDSGMIRKVRSVCPEKEHMFIAHGNRLPLGRWPRMWSSIQQNTPLPAVSLEKNGPFYCLIDGRHRTVASLCYGYTHVPAIIK